MGSSLINPANNHYYGYIGRIGRALSESAQATALEKEMLSIIADQELDSYNRLLMRNLFLEYNYHLENQERYEENIKKINEAVKTLPEYLISQAITQTE